jgi:flagellar biosynthesis anti-sigma factor FlgM
MQIYGPTQLHAAQSITAPHAARSAPSVSPSSAASINDELSISDAAQQLEQIRQMPDIRQDRVDAIRSQIASGTYETADKMDIALSRLLDEIG